MSKISWRQVSALALAAFFVVGSLSNIFAPGSIYEEYLRWGYPHWFHFVTGSLELTTAVLLAQARTRLWGSALGCTVMLAALATVTLHGEYGHGVPPLIVATLSIVVGWIAWRKRNYGITVTPISRPVVKGANHFFWAAPAPISFIRFFQRPCSNRARFFSSWLRTHDGSRQTPIRIKRRPE